MSGNTPSASPPSNEPLSPSSAPISSPLGIGSTPSQGIRVKRRDRSNTVAFQPAPYPSSTNSSSPVDENVANRTRSSTLSPDTALGGSSVAAAGVAGSSNARGRRRGYSIAERLWGEDGYSSVPSPSLSSINMSSPLSNLTVSESGGAVAAGARARSPSINSNNSAGTNPITVVLPGEQAARARKGSMNSQRIQEEDDHHAQEVDLLDVLDPAVSTTATLSNIQGAFWPNFLSKKPIVEIEAPSPSEETKPELGQPLTATSTTTAERPVVLDEDDEYDLLDEHLKKLLKKQKRKEKFRQTMRGIKAFLKTPLGIFFLIYGINVVVWGAGLVLLLIIPMGSYAKKLWVEVCSQVLTALFCVTSLFPLPWRLMDAYHISVIYHYARVTRKRRAKMGLPPLKDPNDLPDPAEAEYWIGAGGEKMTGRRTAPTVPLPKAKKSKKKNKDNNDSTTPEEVVPIELSTIETSIASDDFESVVLTDREEEKLRRAQAKFARSQNYYRPHTTPTHHAFPIKSAVWISLAMIGNSVFQAFLCGCMWGLNRFDRPAWTTGCLIPLSFGCGIAGAILIWQCSERTKRKAEVTAKVWRMMKRDEEELEKRKKEIQEQRIKDHKEGKHHHHHNKSPFKSHSKEGSKTDLPNSGELGHVQTSATVEKVGGV